MAIISALQVTVIIVNRSRGSGSNYGLLDHWSTWCREHVLHNRSEPDFMTQSSLALTYHHDVFWIGGETIDLGPRAIR